MEIYHLCQRVHTRKQSSILIPRSKNEAWFPRCSTLRFNTLGQIVMNDVRNLLSSFIAQSTSVNLETPWYSYSLEGPFEMSCFI